MSDSPTGKRTKTTEISDLPDPAVQDENVKGGATIVPCVRTFIPCVKPAIPCIRQSPIIKGT